MLDQGAFDGGERWLPRRPVGNGDEYAPHAAFDQLGTHRLQLGQQIEVVGALGSQEPARSTFRATGAQRKENTSLPRWITCSAEKSQMADFSI